MDSNDVEFVNEEDEERVSSTTEPATVLITSNDEDTPPAVVADISTEDSKETLTHRGSASRGKVFSKDGDRPSTLKMIFGGRRVNRQSRMVDHDQRTLESAHGYQSVDDIDVTVSDHQKLENYVVYTVQTKTTRGDPFDRMYYTVRRRYKDFLWLREKLEEAFPAHLLPPMPEKLSMQRWTHFTPSFMIARQNGLNKFLQRIASHPVISFNEIFYQFLTTPDHELPDLGMDTAGLFSRMNTSLRTSLSAMMLRNPSAEFANTSDYVDKLRQQLEEVRKVEQTIADENAEMLSAMKLLSMALQDWLKVDNDVSDTLTAVTHCLDKQIQALEGSLAGIDPTVLQPLKEYYLYTDSVKQVLKRRDAVQMDYEMFVDDLRKKEEELDAARTTGQQDKITALETRVRDLSQQVDRKSDLVDIANADLKAEFDRWHSYKRMDMKEIFTEIADRQISYHQQCRDAFRETIEKLERGRGEET
ncbi:sorting nexin-7-like [Corticium candelabrum]|uniref:sorting nexin-7-like n=1 Tax=Corticium candelabrum TaxID=121492 RepID=UPI002E268FA3|nr:sorting nexin-7-like [Corticium candelabrum]